MSYSRIGDIQVAQGDRSGAVRSYRDGLAIAERLAGADPGNAGWQRDLIVSCVKIAETFPDETRAMLTRTLRIATALRDQGRLAQADAWMAR